jgi:hypothetical protein
MSTRAPRHIAILALACLCAAAVAQGFENAAPVDDAVLARTSGGFELPARLNAALQLDRAAYVNGELVADHSVRIADLGAMTAQEAAALAEAARPLVIQNGPRNSFDVAQVGQAATVIQNTLNDQRLASMTTLRVEVNSLAAYREANFQQGLQQQFFTGGVR